MLCCLGNNHTDKGLQVFKYKHNLPSPNCTIHVSNRRTLCIWASLISDWLNLWKRNHGKTKGRRKFALKLPEWFIRWVKTTKTNKNNQKPEARELGSVIDWRTPSVEQGRHGTFWRVTVMGRYLNYTHTTRPEQGSVIHFMISWIKLLKLQCIIRRSFNCSPLPTNTGIINLTQEPPVSLFLCDTFFFSFLYLPLRGDRHGNEECPLDWLESEFYHFTNVPTLVKCTKTEWVAQYLCTFLSFLAHKYRRVSTSLLALLRKQMCKH